MRSPTFPASHNWDVHARQMAKASVIRERVLQRASFGALTVRA